MSEEIGIGVLDDLKAKVLPELFASRGDVGSFGRVESAAPLASSSASSPVSALAHDISLIVLALREARPQQVDKNPSWISRFTGRSLEKQARRVRAQREVEPLLMRAEAHAQQVRDAVAEMDATVAGHAQEVQHLRVHLQAGTEYLSEHPEAGLPSPGVMEFDNTRERMQRRLANLRTLLLSHEMSSSQIRMVRAQATDLLDRFVETTAVLLPVWRQHTRAIESSSYMDPLLVAQATSAHEALQRSLAESVPPVAAARSFLFGLPAHVVSWVRNDIIH